MTTWISVKDRLPELRTDLLLCEVYKRERKTYHAYYLGMLDESVLGKGWYVDGEYYWDDIHFNRITHWAKIEPPEADNDQS